MNMENNIENAHNFGASEFNCKMKRITQDRLKRGLPVSLDIPYAGIMLPLQVKTGVNY